MVKKRDVLRIIIGYVLALIVGFFVYQYVESILGIFYALLIADIAMTFLIFIGSVLYNNSSFYDPYWSVVPPFLVVTMMLALDQVHVWSILVLLAVLVWACRLTFNWYKNFIGFEKEDFRYIDFRKKFPKTYWLISLLAVHLFPTLMVFLGLVPIYLFLQEDVVRPIFVVLGCLTIVSGSIISYYADEQMRDHQKNKYSHAMKEGLWSISRHPNYLGELMMWFGVMVISFSVSYDFIQTLGFLAMLALFELYSIPRMEKRLSARKADYEEVKLEVSRVFPFAYIKRFLSK